MTRGALPNRSLCQYDPPIRLSVSCVPLDCLSISCPERDHRSLLVGLSVLPHSDSRPPPVVPPRNPAPHLRRLSLRPCRFYPPPQPSFALGCRGSGGN